MSGYLTATPRLGPRHQPLFAALSPTEVARVARRMEQDLVLPRTLGVPATADWRWLYDQCVEAGLDHAACVLPLCREHDDIGLSALQKLAGCSIRVWKPRDTPRPPQVVREASGRTVRVESGGFHMGQVVLRVVPNPKKPGSATWHRFQHWRAGDTVGECMSRGMTRADVLWDMDPARKFVVLGTREEWNEQQKA